MQFMRTLRWPSMRNWLIAACLAIFAGQAQAYDTNVVKQVTTANSTTSYIQGQIDPTNAGAQRFLGIPFAAPPVGNLRWHAPQDPPAWGGMRNATQFASYCVQVGGFFTPDASLDKFGRVIGNEDCLYLNVYRPNTTQDNLPVVFWIYGGSNLAGGADDPVYEGAKFAIRNNVVLVTANYRLGMLGFLYQAALHAPGNTALDNSGNFATLDLVKSLGWVQKNITTFGGNPHNVTIAGQSAGCINAWGLIQTPLAAGKFHKAICMSGFPSVYPTVIGQGFADQLVVHLLMDQNPGLTFSQADSLRKSMSASSIRNVLYGASAAQIVKYTPRPATPVHFIDGKVIPTLFGIPNGVPGILTCNYNKVPMIIGGVRDEGTLFVAAGGAIPDLVGLWNKMNYNNPVPTLENTIAPQWLQPAGQPFTSSPYYRTSRTMSDLVTFLTDQVYRYLHAQILCGPPPMYRYQFTWSNIPQPWRDIYNSAHGTDVHFFFNAFYTNKPDFHRFAWNEGNRADREDLSALMNHYFANFAWNGNPNNSRNNPMPYRYTPYWNAWTNLPGLPKRMVFNASPGMANAGMASFMSTSEELAAINDILKLSPMEINFTVSMLKDFIPETWLNALGLKIPK